MNISRETLEALVARAQRQEPLSGAEKRAVEDAEDLLREDFQAAFPVSHEQLTLFDSTPYEEV